MNSLTRRLRELSTFQVAVLLLLLSIATLQYLTLQRLPMAPTMARVRAAAAGDARKAVLESIPLVDIYGAVEVDGSVTVDGTVEVEGTVNVDDIYSEVAVSIGDTVDVCQVCG